MIEKAVQSALEQSGPGDEVIVVDDGSSDNTLEILAAFGNRIIVEQLNHAGAGVARNTGIARAKNELVAFLDSDDEWMPGKLELQRAFMEKRPDVLFCFSDFAVRNSRGIEQHNYLKNWHNDQRGWDEILGPGEMYSTIMNLPDKIADFKYYVGNIYVSELTANYIFTGTLMARRLEAGDSLHFGEGLPTFEDWECFGLLAKRGKAAYFSCETAWQISHSGPRLTQADILNTAKARITLMERVWGSDTDFLNSRGDLYRQTLAEQRLQKIRGLLRQGSTQEARTELKDVGPAPLTYKLMASLPPTLATGIVHLRRLLTRG